MMLQWFILALIATSTCARSTSTTQNQIDDGKHEEARSTETSSFFGDFRYVYKVYQECAAKELIPCLKLKLITAVDRVARNYNELPLFDGVSFVKDPKAAATTAEASATSEEEIEATLPRSMTERDDALNNLMADKVSNFFDTHTLQVKLPSSTELARGFQEEGRKKKKGGGYLILPLILGGTMIPLALGALALLAGKALIVSKLALVLAAIIGLKKLLSGGHGGGEGHGSEVVVSNHGSGWGRSYVKDQAQNLAYSAHVPQTR